MKTNIGTLASLRDSAIALIGNKANRKTLAAMAAGGSGILDSADFDCTATEVLRAVRESFAAKDFGDSVDGSEIGGIERESAPLAYVIDGLVGGWFGVEASIASAVRLGVRKARNR